MNAIIQKDKHLITFDLIKKSLIDLERMNKSYSNLNSEKILAFLKKN